MRTIQGKQTGWVGYRLCAANAARAATNNRPFYVDKSDDMHLITGGTPFFAAHHRQPFCRTDGSLTH
ncbi:MAG: hypothetical protein HQL88_05650 [Magnetococcales bacterium]|nr:hypothetical protein [Magnetococcales bacterium]